MNRSNFGANTNVIQIMLDALLVSAACGLSFLCLGIGVEKEVYISVATLTFVFGFLLLLSNKGKDLYNITRFSYLDKIFLKQTGSFLTATLIVLLLMWNFEASHQVKEYMWIQMVILYILLCFKLLFVHPVNKWIKTKNAPRTAFIGTREQYMMFFEYWKKTCIRMKPIGFISIKKEAGKADAYLGCVDDLETLIKEHHIDQIYMLQKDGRELYDTQQYLDLCIEMGVTMGLVIDLYEQHSAYGHVSAVGTYPVITYHTVSLNTYEQVCKRILDLIGGVVGLILSAPIMLVAAILIKIDSPGPVLYKQMRVGKNGRQFMMYKFRSMYYNEETSNEELMSQNEIEGGVMFKMKNDPRVTPVGKWLRRLSIDEMPQFIHVIQGTMSLVGTRPPTVEEVEKYSTKYWRRISIKPGMTGLWQVSGRSNITDFEEIVRLDVKYIDEWSLTSDISIILKTFLTLFKHEDAY